MLLANPSWTASGRCAKADISPWLFVVAGVVLSLRVIFLYVSVFSSTEHSCTTLGLWFLEYMSVCCWFSIYLFTAAMKLD